MITKICFIKKLLEENQIKFWLDCGALLHLYRDRTIKDNDIDFCLLLDEYDKCFSLINSLSQAGTIQIKHIWDKEISFFYQKLQFDLIFCTTNENFLYIYSYQQNPLTPGRWTWEWRAKFPVSCYFPLAELSYCNIKFAVPCNIEEKLRYHYGSDWKTPKAHMASWPAKDLSYNPIAVCIPTFLRDESIMKVVPSYLKYPLKLYILDQGRHSEVKDKFYADLRAKNHWVEYSNFDIGVSAARNAIISHIEEPFFLLTEDDMELVSNPYVVLNMFDERLDLGVVGGRPFTQPQNTLENYNYELQIKDHILYYKRTGKYDIVENFAVMRTKIFKEVKYDEQLKLAEHSDFYLQLKQLNKWKIDIHDKLIGKHFKSRTGEYASYRNKSDYYAQIMRKKWDITGGVYDK